eukprot:384632_1
MAANIEKLQQMFPLVEVSVIKEIIAKNPGNKIYTEAIPQLKLIQEYKSSTNPDLEIAPSAPSATYEAASPDESEGDVPLTNVISQKNENSMNQVLLKTQEDYAAINSVNTDIDYGIYPQTACCECCCGDPRKPSQPHWTCDCRECCKCCFLLPNDDNYNGGFLYAKDVKLFMYGVLILIFMSIPAEIAYEIDADIDGKKLFLGVTALFLALIAVVLYFMKCGVGKSKNMFIGMLLLIAAGLYLTSYIYHTVYLKDFTPDFEDKCSNWNEYNDCSWYWEGDYCGHCICQGICDECTNGFSETFDDCYHFEQSYFASRGVYIFVIMGLLGLHFVGITKVINSRIGYLKFMTILLIFYSVCIGGVTGGNYFNQIVFSGCPSLVVALLLFILYFLIDKMNKNLKYKGGCNGIISVGSLVYIFLFWNTLAQIVMTAIGVANWDDDKGFWLWCWELSITVFGFFNFLILLRALHPCMMCKTCNC